MLAVLAGCLIFRAEMAAAAELTLPEARGKQIYFREPARQDRRSPPFSERTTSKCRARRRRAPAVTAMTASAGAESGVIPSNVTWRYLMRSYGHVHPGGLEHGPFSVANLKSYLRDGVYPGGRLGDPAMPVYDIPEEDLDDLIAYMKRLDTYVDPGLSDTSIRIGTLVPGEGAGRELGEVLRATIAAYFADINSRGGIYGRSLELAPGKISGGEGPGRLRDILTEQQAFALVGTDTPGLEQEVGALAEDLHLPLIAPFMLLSPESETMSRYRFNLYGTMRDRVCALARFATGRPDIKDPRITILHPQQRHG